MFKPLDANELSLSYEEKERRAFIREAAMRAMQAQIANSRCELPDAETIEPAATGWVIAATVLWNALCEAEKK